MFLDYEVNNYQPRHTMTQSLTEKWKIAKQTETLWSRKRVEIESNQEYGLQRGDNHNMEAVLDSSGVETESLNRQ